MEPEHVGAPEISVEQTPQKANQWNTVTPLSKYLAMALFVSLPFVGFYLGYTYGSEEIVKKNTSASYMPALDDEDTHTFSVDESQPQVESTSANEYREPSFGDFVLVDPALYNIPSDDPALSVLQEDYFYDDIEAYMAKRLTDDLLLVALASPSRPTHGPRVVVVYNDKTDQIVRATHYPWLSLSDWVSPTIQVFVSEGFSEGTATVYVRDYVANTEAVLYTESDPEVYLSDFCDVSCDGLLYTTTDGTVVFSRHKEIEGTTATEFIETISVLLPEEFRGSSYYEYVGKYLE